MSNDLFERVLIQLQPELAQEFGYAILEDMKKIKALEIIKECFNLNGFDELIPNSKWFESEEKQDLVKEVLL